MNEVRNAIILTVVACVLLFLGIRVIAQDVTIQASDAGNVTITAPIQDGCENGQCRPLRNTIRGGTDLTIGVIGIVGNAAVDICDRTRETLGPVAQLIRQRGRIVIYRLRHR